MLIISGAGCMSIAPALWHGEAATAVLAAVFTSPVKAVNTVTLVSSVACDCNNVWSVYHLSASTHSLNSQMHMCQSAQSTNYCQWHSVTL